VSPIGYRSIRVSDLSGQIIPENEVLTVIVRNHADSPENKVFDCTAAELAELQGLDDIVELELKWPNGVTQTVVTTRENFDTVVPPEQLKGFDSARGRRSNYRPGTNGG
jgi:hypothetical protein